MTEEYRIKKVEHEKQQATLVQQKIRVGLKMAECAAADDAIADFFFANGISFNVADNSINSYYHRMISAIRQTPAGYIPPNAAKLSGPLLDSRYKSIWNDIDRRDPHGNLAKKFGATYVSDGWESIDSLPLVNSAIVTANNSGVYWRSVDTSGKTKDAEFLASLMITDIYDIGCTSVVLVVTDTCSTMKKCWNIVQDEFPWISVLPCQPHVASLLLKDIGKIKEVDTLIKEESTVVSWFSNHQKPLAIVREKSEALLGKVKQFVKAGATRFGTHTLVGERLLELQSSLQAAVVDPEYVKQGYKDEDDSREEGNGETYVRENKGGTTKRLILDDSFWSRIKQHVRATKPIFKLLRRHDSSAPTVGKAYHGWFQLKEDLASCPELSQLPYKKEIEVNIDQRWAYGHSEFAAAAYVVDPEFHRHDQAKNSEVMEGFMNTVEKLAILIEVRRREEESTAFSAKWKQRRDLIAGDCSQQATWTHYPTYPTLKDAAVTAFCSKVNAQLVNYRNSNGIFSRDYIMAAAADMPAHHWWDAHGSSVPELQSVACMILAQPGSSSICERINSEFAFVKDRRRNRLSHERADKLVSLFHNLRLMSKMQKTNYVEPMASWTTEDTSSGITKYGVANY